MEVKKVKQTNNFSYFILFRIKNEVTILELSYLARAGQSETFTKRFELFDLPNLEYLVVILNAFRLWKFTILKKKKNCI